jgi:hypothetical protein
MIEDAGGNMVNGTTVIYYGDAEAPVLEVGAYVTLAAGENRMVNLRRYELDVQPNTLNYFCWGLCYLEQEAGALPVWQSQPNHALELTAGVPVSDFKAYHVPNGQLGNSSYRFVWFDVGNPNDTAWVDIEFRSSPVGVEEFGTGVRTFNIFPNPSMGNDVRITVDLEGGLEGTSLVVYNALGGQVQASTLASLHARNVLPVAGLPSGIYFAAVQRHGVALATKRFVITSGR